MVFSNVGKIVIGVFCLLALVACDGKKKADQATVPAGGGQIGFPVKGEAKEVINTGGYTYVLIGNGKQETWVAVPETKVAVGEKVAVTEGQVMHDFTSKTLNKTFPELVFAAALDGKAPPAAGADPHGGAATSLGEPVASGADQFGAAMQKEAGAQTGSGPGADAAADVATGSSKAVVPFAALKVAKASGANAYTVAELFGQAVSLNGKKVRIQGQVVKFSAGIMGKNWLHLQDGTGDPKKNSHDLVVTAVKAEAQKGEVVTVEGVLAANKDFGFGYKYEVIVEDVTITR